MSNKLKYKEFLTDDKDKQCIKKFESKIKKFVIKTEKETLKNDIINLKKELTELNKKVKLTKTEERKKSSAENMINMITKFLNDKERFNNNITKLVDNYIFALCNHTCKGTLFEIGDKNKLPDSWKKAINFPSDFYQENPGLLKIYFKIRRKYYSGESFTKNTVNKDEINIMKKAGLISYCEGPGMISDVGILLKK